MDKRSNLNQILQSNRQGREVLALASPRTGVVSGSDVSMTRVRSQALVNAIIKPSKNRREL
jgi:hypothetical protein